MTIMIMITAVAVMVMGAFLSRVRGADRIPPGLDLLLYAMPLAVAGWAAGVPWWAALIVLAVTMSAESRGHGDYMRLGREPLLGFEDREWLKPVLDLVFGKASAVSQPYWRQFAGLAIGGAAVMAPLALAAAICVAPIWFVLVGLGALKAVAYEVGWRWAPGGRETTWGEYGRGAFQYAAIPALLFLPEAWP